MSDKTTDQIGALLNDDRGVGTAAGAEVSHIPAPISCEDEFEAAYQKIGWWKGPNASAEAWARVREFWRHQGDQGFSWLASRLRREWHIDLLDGVASLLAEADGAAIPAILEELERQPSRDQARGAPQGTRLDGRARRQRTALGGDAVGTDPGDVPPSGRPRPARMGGTRGSAAPAGVGTWPCPGPTRFRTRRRSPPGDRRNRRGQRQRIGRARAMWLLRCARKNRWHSRSPDDPLDVAEAAKDLSLRPGEAGLSLFEVEDDEDGRRIATLFGVHRTLTFGRSDHVDYLLVPAGVFASFGLTIAAAADPRLGPQLSERHREANVVTNATGISLAAAILKDGRFKVERIKKRDVEKAAREARPDEPG